MQAQSAQDDPLVTLIPRRLEQGEYPHLTDTCATTHPWLFTLGGSAVHRYWPLKSRALHTAHSTPRQWPAVPPQEPRPFYVSSKTPSSKPVLLNEFTLNGDTWGLRYGCSGLTVVGILTAGV